MWRHRIFVYGHPFVINALFKLSLNSETEEADKMNIKENDLDIDNDIGAENKGRLGYFFCELKCIWHVNLKLQIY